MDKKPSRFCLGFDRSDPVQDFAYNIISTQGRKKSAFIARAVKYYVENSTAGAEVLCEFDGSFARTLVLGALKELVENGNLSSAVQNINIQQPALAQTKENVQSEPAVPVSNTTYDKENIDKQNVATDEDVDVLLDGLAMFS